MLSIVIPTYNERENLQVLVPRIFDALSRAGIEGEVIVVDDNSPDGTAGIAEKLAERHNVRVVRRAGKMGLSSAVLEGFIHARGDVLCAMDADLSHPPEAIPEMMDKLKESDMVFGSRNVTGGGIESWSVYRKVVSRGAALLARPLTHVRDPMSGFFMVNRSLLDDADLNPRGFKIGLEIAVRCSPAITEVPIMFRNRTSGESKLGAGEVWNYLLHLKGLYLFRMKSRLRPGRGCANHIKSTAK